MTIEGVATRVSVGSLVALAGVHVAWGLGSSWPLPDRESLADTVVGQPAVPGAAACFAVAGALGTAALFVSGRPRRRPAVARLGALGVAGVLGVRGAVGLAGRTELLSPGSSSTRFRRLDRLVYSPLCLTLAAGSALSAGGRGR
ncbi:DUF3995 domain-containing protein [Embleya sp. AB8]|uniref:DUF3995 domain-containing protein n=1 Tax=Embleya sp. AB8 TaxID=3156304 RepID=UPI003C756F60